MTLTYELDLKIPRKYLHIKNELSALRLSNVKALQKEKETEGE